MLLLTLLWAVEVDIFIYIAIYSPTHVIQKEYLLKKSRNNQRLIPLLEKNFLSLRKRFILLTILDIN